MGETLHQIMGRHRAEPLPERKPSWLKVRAPGGSNYARLKHLMRELDLHTVCEEAHCPNVGECWEHGTATFMILGDVCTRNCAYCAVAHGRPPKYDPAEPSRVAEAVAEMRLQHAVITSVDRDDLPDFGAWAFAETIREIQRPIRVLRTRDAKLYDQIRRAASSVALNLAEGSGRRGRDRVYHWRIAAGSASELRAALRVAEAWGDLDTAALGTAFETLARLESILWRMTH